MKATASRHTASPLPTDNALLALGADLEVAWLAERRVFATKGIGDDAMMAAADVTSAIIQKILETPADSLDGLRIKGRAVSWCYDGEPFDPAELVTGATGQATANRLAASILADVLRMATPTA